MPLRSDPRWRGQRAQHAVPLQRQLQSSLKALADAKYVPVRVTQVHLAYVPRHVSRRESDVQPSGHALFVDLLNIVHPDGHPRALVGRFLSLRSKRGSVCPSASTALASLTKKDLAFTGAHRSESRRRAPVPALFPTPLLEPGKARGDVGNVQYGRNGFGIHAAEE